MPAHYRPHERLIPPYWLLTLLVVYLLLWLIVALREIVTLLVVGFSIAYVLDPLLDRLENRKIPRSLGFFLLCGIFLTFVAVLALTALPTVIREYKELVKNLPDYMHTLKTTFLPLYDRVLEWWPALPIGGGGTTPPSDPFASLTGNALDKILKGFSSALLSGYSITLTIINLLLLPIIAYYLSVDFNNLYRNFLRIFPLSYRRSVAEIMTDIDWYLGAFVRGQFIVCLILLLMYSLGLWIIGIELSLLVAIVSAFGEFIPYLGFITGISLASLMSLVTFGDWGHLWQVWLLYAAVQFVQANFITPAVLGRRVRLSPLVVILAVFAGGKLFGLLGVLLAVPGAAVVKVLVSRGLDWVKAREQAQAAG